MTANSENAGLAALERQVARDLELLCLPAKPWIPQRAPVDGQPVSDVIVVGAGMNGIGAAASLIFKGVGNIRILEASQPGREGPWLTFARMDTLRSPKTLPGPVPGLASLTFRAWYEASFGVPAWEALYKIPNGVWVDYLGWIMRVLKLPVSHGVSVEAVRAQDGLLALDTSSGGRAATLLARRVVLATGRGGSGGDFTPGFVDRALWPDLAAHTNEAIDFARLRGRSIAVLGGSASAWDNAATALEQGAGRVDMYVRRKTLPQVNKGRGSASPGYFHGWQALDLADRWSLLVYLSNSLAPPPHETVLRALKQPNLHVHLGHPVASARRADGRAVLTVAGPEGSYEARHDFLIVGTGFDIDTDKISVLGDLRPHIARWADVYTPPEALRRPDLARHPFLGAGFELMPRTPAAPAELSHIHLLNYGAQASHGAVASDVPGTPVAAERLATAITASLFREDIAAIRAELEAFDEPELETTPYFVPPSER